jgi:hypothetical protein
MYTKLHGVTLQKTVILYSKQSHNLLVYSCYRQSSKPEQGSKLWWCKLKGSVLRQVCGSGECSASGMWIRGVFCVRYVDQGSVLRQVYGAGECSASGM